MSSFEPGNCVSKKLLKIHSLNSYQRFRGLTQYCKAKRQYLLTLQVSGYCILALRGSIILQWLFFRKTIVFDDLCKSFGRIFCRSFSVRVAEIHLVESEFLGISTRPFKVVHQGPGKVTSHVTAVVPDR